MYEYMIDPACLHTVRMYVRMYMRMYVRMYVRTCVCTLLHYWIITCLLHLYIIRYDRLLRLACDIIMLICTDRYGDRYGEMQRPGLHIIHTERERATKIQINQNN